MPFWETDKRQSTGLDEETKDIIRRIQTRFHVDVVLRVSMTAAEMLKLYSALEKICKYYGIDSIPCSKEPLRIILKKKVWSSNSLFHFREHPIDGLFEYGTNSIHLPADHPGALVHELIHAIDYAFRNPSMNRSLTFIDDSGKDALVRFLKKRGAGEKVILDFEDAYKRMQGSMSEYLRTPSEIIARMGAYSFWNDNKEACEDNPFLKFSYAPYTELNEKTGSIKTIDQFPFHSIDAVRLFVHHASRDIAREKTDRWHPPFSEDFASEHDSEWYRKAWYRLDDARYSVNDAERIIRENSNAISSSPHMPDDDRKWHEDAIRRARLQLPSATENLESIIALLSRDVMTDELQERILNLERDDGIRLAISFLQECQGFSLLREKHPERAQKRQTERERQEI